MFVLHEKKNEFTDNKIYITQYFMNIIYTYISNNYKL